MSIFISLTTVPDRLVHWISFGQNVQSLLRQKTDKDYKVVVNIPRIYTNMDIPYNVPQQLLDLAASDSRLIINRIETDRGPIEKVVGCFNLATDPEDTIIALDDDHVYHEDMLEYIFKKQQEYPYAVIGFRGDNILEKRDFWHNNVKKYALMGTHAFFPLKHDMNAAVPGHWHSVTYKRKFIQDDFFNDYFFNVAASDDHKISFYLIEKGIEYKIVAWDKETDFVPVNYMIAGHGKPSHHFPIVEQLGYPQDTGFNLFRKKTGDHLGFVRSDFTKNWIFNQDKWYYEPPYTAAYEVKIPDVRETVTKDANGQTVVVRDGDAVPDVVIDDSFVYPTTPPVITLTTIPSRLAADYDAGIKSCINSLVTQEYPGQYEVHFNVPVALASTGEEYVIPKWITDLATEKPFFKIFRTEDYGPVTKLYPTVVRTTGTDTIIVVCDDDLVYYPEMLKEQVHNQTKFTKSAVGYDGIDCWVPIFNDVRDHYITAVRKYIKTKTLQHYKTISYKRSFFENDFKAFMDEYYEWNDDLFLAAYMGKKNIKRVVTYSEQHTPNYVTLDEWNAGNAAITFPVLSHTAHEGQEGCTIYRMKDRPHFKKNVYTADLIEKYIN